MSEATDQRPVGTREVWILLLAGPVIATTYFMVIYLIAEAACAHDIHGFSTVALQVSVGVATVVALGALAYPVWRSRALARSAARGEHGENVREVIIAALILLGLFAFMTVLLAASAFGPAC